MLTDKQTVEFLRMIKSGKNTYGELQKRFPMEFRDWVLFIDDTIRINPPAEALKIGIIEFVDPPKLFTWHYDFKDTDTFKLTVAGQNLLDRADKEFWLHIFAGAAAVAAVLTLVLGAVQIWLSLCRYQ